MKDEDIIQHVFVENNQEQEEHFSKVYTVQDTNAVNASASALLGLKKVIYWLPIY